MSAIGPTGIDMLCDAAAGSGFTTSPLPHIPQSQPASSAPSTEPTPIPLVPPPGDATALPRALKRKLPGTPPPRSSAASSHVCRICNRVYERADHLTRHLRAHENARPYQCTRCPKRFNRADLLTRHEATHDRDGADGGGRPFIRRSDRAAEACVHCAVSKAKCEDEKPCRRCRNRNLLCEMPPRRPNHLHNAPGSQHAIIPAPEPTTPSSMAVAQESAPGSSNQLQYDPAMSTGVGSAPQLNGTGPPLPAGGPPVFPVLRPGPAVVPPPVTTVPATGADGIPYYATGQNTFHDMQDMDFSSWDIDFGDFSVPPHFETAGPSASPANSGVSSRVSSSRTIMRDPARGHEAFKRSPWLWEPDPGDYAQRVKEGLDVRDDVARSLKIEPVSRALYSRIKMDAAMRDKLFALVLEQNRDRSLVPSFPSLGLLNYILLMHFSHEGRHFDSFIHPGSFDPAASLPVLVAAILAHGAIFVSAPAIWKFGLAIHEVVRGGLSCHIEDNNFNTRDLRTLQAYLLTLDVGIWSGFKRKTEVSEAFLSPLVTMIRRAGRFTMLPDSPNIIPTESDSKERLQEKWREFIRRESFKRVVIHALIHDAQSSMSLCKHPSIAFTELSFSLPSSRDLWMADSAEHWRDIYLDKARTSPVIVVPNISSVANQGDAIRTAGDHVDKELCYAALFYGFRSQISGFWESNKFYTTIGVPSGVVGCPAPGSASGDAPANTPPWLRMQYDQIYGDLRALSANARSPAVPLRHLGVASEFMMMTAHVSLDDLQRFAGKAGEREANRVSDALDQCWAATSVARHAVWHAGRVFRQARLLPPTFLRDFLAVAVYYASLTLWIYGMLRPEDPLSTPLSADEGTPGSAAAAATASLAGHVLIAPVDGVEGESGADARAFLLQQGPRRCVPGLCVGGGVKPLSTPGVVLGVAREILRANFPVKEEPLPPLVESLSCLMRDLSMDGR